MGHHFMLTMRKCVQCFSHLLQKLLNSRYQLLRWLHLRGGELRMWRIQIMFNEAVDLFTHVTISSVCSKK